MRFNMSLLLDFWDADGKRVMMHRDELPKTAMEKVSKQFKRGQKRTQQGREKKKLQD